MALPILNARGAVGTADLIRLFHHTEAAFASILSDPEELEVGTAYASAEFGSVWDANCVRNVALPAGVSPAQGYEQVQRHFEGKGCRCAYWVINPSAGVEQTGAMVEYLVGLGYRVQVDEVMRLSRRSEIEESGLPEYQVLPARAAFGLVRELTEVSVAERWKGAADLVEATIRDLEDPHVEGIVVLHEGRAVGSLKVLTWGEIGRIESVYVRPEYRNRGVGKLMMHRALAMCARAMYRHVFLGVDPENQRAKRLYGRAGFERVGEVRSYRAT